MGNGIAVQFGDNRHGQGGNGIRNRHRVQPGDALRQWGLSDVVGRIGAPDGEHRAGARDNRHGNIVAQRQGGAAVAQLGGSRSGDSVRRAAGRNGNVGLRRRNPIGNVSVTNKRPSRMARDRAMVMWYDGVVNR